MTLITGRRSLPDSSPSPIRWPRGRLQATFLLGLLLAVTPARAVVCTVPGSHPTIQAAADDVNCTTVALAAQLFSESVVFTRALAVEGQGAPATLVRGLLRAGAGGDVVLADLRIESGCDPVLQAVDGGRIEGSALETVRDSALPCPSLPLVVDGFETGDLGRWSSHYPL